MSEHRYRMCSELDLASVPRVRAELQLVIDNDDAHLLVDCTDLTFIDSTGVAALLEALRALQARGRQMLITNVAPGPRRVFELLGLTDLMRYDRHTRDEQPA